MNPELHHEHASVSLKVLLLIFSVLLIIALGSFVYLQNNAVDTTDYSTTKPVPKVKQVETEDKAIACGDTKLYGFSLTFGDKWSGYKVKEVKPDYAIVTCYFEMPTASTDSVWTEASIDHDANYASIFAVSVYTPAQWQTALTEPNASAELGHNDSYYWGYAPAQSLPEDLAATNIDDDISNVVATFSAL